MNELNRVEDHKSYSVRKDNRLLQTVNRRKYELTALEQKALGYIISCIKPTDTEITQPYFMKFDMNLFIRMCGINDSGKNYQNIKQALERLAGNQFWIKTGDKKELLFQWIAVPELDREDRTIEIEIPKKIVPYLVGLNEKYTEYELSNILVLKKTHSIALYEFLKSYAYTHKAEIGIEEFKSYLGINKDTDYRNLRRQIIDPAIKEINEKTDLYITWDSIKRGRKVIKLYFRISKRNYVQELIGDQYFVKE